MKMLRLAVVLTFALAIVACSAPSPSGYSSGYSSSPAATPTPSASGY